MLQGVWPRRDGEIWTGCRYHGDAAAGAARIGQVAQALQRLKTLNANDLPVFQVCQDGGDGSWIVVHRHGNLYGADVFVPPAPVTAAVPDLPSGQCLHVPGCLARYDGATAVNAIPRGDLAGWSLGFGSDVMVVAPKRVGLPNPSGLPEAGIGRKLGVFVLPGGAASGLLYGRAHIPDAAPFSVGCLVRLRRFLDYDYTYDARDVLNPIRTYLLQSRDGVAFSHDCPGSIAPLIGFCSPHRNPGWWTTLTYPWAPWNTDYAANTESLQGTMRAQSACDDAPLLEGAAYRDAAGRDYPYPYGFLMGIQAAGLFVYNGNRLLGARLSHFESQLGYVPAVTEPLDYGVWYHALMTHDADGDVRVHLARAGKARWLFTGRQPLCAMDANCSYQASGVNAWTLSNGATGQVIGAYRMHPVMDVALPRFYHRVLSSAEVGALQAEGLHGLFVADDHEAAQALARGIVPVAV